jgi:hypothetical protein
MFIKKIPYQRKYIEGLAIKDIFNDYKGRIFISYLQISDKKRGVLTGSTPL